MTLSQAAVLFAGLGVGVTEAMHHGVKEGCKIILDAGTRAIGTYDFGWPQLAASTQDDRVRKGFSPNEPLLRTAELRGSYEMNTSMTGFTAEGYVGSDNMKAVWQELGTRSIPPRPVTMAAAIRNEVRIREMIGRRGIAALSLGGAAHLVGPTRP